MSTDELTTTWTERQFAEIANGRESPEPAPGSTEDGYRATIARARRDGLTLRLGREGDAYWAEVPELGVVGEGMDPLMAIRDAESASRALLETLRHDPEATKDPRQCFVPFLHRASPSWFLRFETASADS